MYVWVAASQHFTSRRGREGHFSIERTSRTWINCWWARKNWEKENWTRQPGCGKPRKDRIIVELRCSAPFPKWGHNVRLPLSAWISNYMNSILIYNSSVIISIVYFSSWFPPLVLLLLLHSELSLDSGLTFHLHHKRHNNQEEHDRTIVALHSSPSLHLICYHLII